VELPGLVRPPPFKQFGGYVEYTSPALKSQHFSKCSRSPARVFM
jgi:hypothetical protein